VTEDDVRECNEPLSTAEANRRFYREGAAAYEANEDCLCSERQQARLRSALDDALGLLAPDPLVLDACGGTGNVGTMLQRDGITPVVVDVSPEMTAIWDAKARRDGVVAEIHHAPIEDFFGADDRAWDMITFSSALHHLEDYTQVVLTAGGRLRPGGLLLTIFDPTSASRGMRVVRKLDWVGWLVLKNPRGFADTLVAAARRSAARRSAAPADGAEHVGRLAERYAYTGIDDHALVRTLRGAGLEVLAHERYADARLAPMRFVLRRLERPSSFRLLLRRPA